MFALWQKAFGSDALELITGVDRMVLKYGASRSDYGGQIGYFDAYALPVGAEVVLVVAQFTLSNHTDSLAAPRQYIFSLDTAVSR